MIGNPTLQYNHGTITRLQPLIMTSMTGNDKIFETRWHINYKTQLLTLRSHLPEELHETKSVTVLFRDTHANNIGSGSNQSSIPFKHNCSTKNNILFWRKRQFSRHGLWFVINPTRAYESTRGNWIMMMLCKTRRSLFYIVELCALSRTIGV